MMTQEEIKTAIENMDELGQKHFARLEKLTRALEGETHSDGISAMIDIISSSIATHAPNRKNAISAANIISNMLLDTTIKLYENGDTA